MEFSVTRSASAGVDKKATHVKDLQLCPKDLDTIPDVHDGDFLKVVTNHDTEQLQVYCRVERRDDSFSSPLSEGEVGLGVSIREALGVSPDDGDTVTVMRPGFDEASHTRRLMNNLLGYRPVVVRVRRSVYPDTGLKVIRTTEGVRQTLGIEWGDRVVLQSADARIREIKALPITEKQQAKIEERETDPDSRYPPPFTEQELGRKTGTKTDISRAYISASLRDDLNLAAYGNRAGIYQPIKIHRDTGELFLRLADDLTIPFLLGAIGLVVGIDIPIWMKLSILAFALFLVSISVVFQSRRILLE